MLRIRTFTRFGSSMKLIRASAWAAQGTLARAASYALRGLRNITLVVAPVNTADAHSACPQERDGYRTEEKQALGFQRPAAHIVQ